MVKKKQTGKIWIILLVLAGLGISLYFIVFQNPAPVIKVPRENISFRHDGDLYFINTHRHDTLARIDIEIADDYNSRRQGLMDRDSLGVNQGMLFIYSQETDHTYWMKNTRISLDIIFVGNDRKIKYIAAHATPYSTNPIPGFYPARYVIEVNAGFCQEYNIKPGTLIDF